MNEPIYSSGIVRYVELDRCLACGGSELTPYLQLPDMPLANDFRTPENAEPANLPTYSLGLNVCATCYHSQNLVAVDPTILYSNYAYASGTSATLRQYFGGFVTRVEQDGPGHRALRVLDIACNDGSLLKEFQARGHKVYGVDPAQNLADEALIAGVPVTVGFWSERTIELLNVGRGRIEQFDVIVAMNVLGHTSDPLTFLQLCKRVLAPGGRIYVQTSQAHMVENCEFDTVYHEHLSFFTARSFSRLARRAGLVIEEMIETPIHGGSYLVQMKDDGGLPWVGRVDQEDTEDAHGVYDLVTYEHFQQRVKDRLDLTRHALNMYRAGRKVVGYGAAAKAMTFINALLPAWRHERDHPFAYFVDDSPLKQGTLCPGSGIPVLPPDALDDEPTSLLIVVGSWNFLPEIKERVKVRRPDRKDLFLVYFPTLNVTG